jgi:uncharacterized protein (TIGR02246 family)
MQNDENAIRNLVATWLDATGKGELATVLQLMADDVIFMVPGREPFGKAAFAANNEQMKNVRIAATSEIQEIQVVADWAWMRSRLRVTITPPQGQANIRSGYVLTILRRNPDGSWVIARDANLLTEEKNGSPGELGVA